ncbi:Outer membrane efflux protein [Rubripirellula lacrimiformis]|uniref:Outer membrane efflux protein n=1 Tax=Rubripirellula lacrimiformis TaxID=1930273 RepID=A0A517N4R9_9BACT|nr:TolC family protein [Rubripirellula lacrimiformis]QDT02130.1 Outer membrane efflux protein [Rubripirellula lacrimiformis]
MHSRYQSTVAALLVGVTGCAGSSAHRMAMNPTSSGPVAATQQQIHDVETADLLSPVSLVGFADDSSAGNTTASDSGSLGEAGLNGANRVGEQEPMPIVIDSTPFVSSGGESLQDAWAMAVAVDQKLQSKANVTGAAVYAHQAAKSARNPSLRTFNSYTALDREPGIGVNIPGLSSLGFGSLPIGEKDFFSSATLASVPLYTSGRISSTIDATCSNVHASRFDERSETHDLKMEVAQAYVGVLKAEKLVEVARLSVTTLEKHLVDVSDLFDEGVVANSDVLAVKTTLSGARDKYLQASNGLDLASAAYNRLIGRNLDAPVSLAELTTSQPTSSEIAVSGLPIQAGPDELVAIATAQRSELQSVAHKSNALRHQAKRELAALGPQVGAAGGYSFLENDNLTHEGFWSASLLAEWTVFDGGVARNKAASLRQQASALARLKRDLESRIALQVRQAWLNLQNANDRIKVAEVSVEQAEENLKVALDRYRKEVGTNTEVLDAQTLLAETRNNYFAATYDATLARVTLDRATGSL